LALLLRICWISSAKRGADERKFPLVSVEKLCEESQRSAGLAKRLSPL